jgi:anti-sigma regulatory factor (Ser/Thr protein kinase)
MSVMTGPPMTHPARPSWPLFSVLPPMGALATAPRTARMHLRDTLKEWGLPELIEDGELIASELVTNVVKRAHDPVTGRPVYVNDRLPVLQFGLFSDRRVLLVSVWDQFADPPVRKVATADDESGRGLMMVGRISASLDWHPVPGGKVVRSFLRAAP